MKKTLSLFFIAIVLSNCQKVDERNNYNKISITDYVDENIVFIDKIIRSINNQEYVREIVVKDYNTDSSKKIDILGFGLDGETFRDDGLFNDLFANDGVYTSESRYEHNENIYYDKYIYRRSVTDEINIGSNFLFVDKLKEDYRKYIRPGINNRTFEVKLGCKVGTCSCNQCRCNACGTIFDVGGCFYFYDCEASVTIKW